MSIRFNKSRVASSVKQFWVCDYINITHIVFVERNILLGTLGIFSNVSYLLNSSGTIYLSYMCLQFVWWAKENQKYLSEPRNNEWINIILHSFRACERINPVRYLCSETDCTLCLSAQWGVVMGPIGAFDKISLSVTLLRT